MQQAIKHLVAKDKKLAKVIRKCGQCTIERKRIIDPYRALSRSIIYQQLATKAAASIYKRFLAIGEGNHPKPEEIISASDTQLRVVGLSRQKASYIRDLAEKKIAGELPSTRRINSMTDDEIIAELTKVKGVGPWSVEMYLMFTLGRLDILPVTDYGIQKGFSKLYLDGDTLPTKDDFAKRSKLWAPWRSVASWYLWRALEVDL